MRETLHKFYKKVENFWYHYKIVTLIVLFFVASGLYLAVDAVKKSDPDMVIAYVGEQYGDESQFGRAEDVLLPLVGDINEDGKTRINYRLMVIRPSGIATYDVDMEQAYNYSFLDKDVRLYFIDKKFLEGKELYFEPLDAFLSAESLEGGHKNADGQVCALPLSGNALAAKMDFDREEMYLAVKRIMDPEKHDALVKVKHEKAIEVAQYIIETYK